MTHTDSLQSCFRVHFSVFESIFFISSCCLLCLVPVKLKLNKYIWDVMLQPDTQSESTLSSLRKHKSSKWRINGQHWIKAHCVNLQTFLSVWLTLLFLKINTHALTSLSPLHTNGGFSFCLPIVMVTRSIRAELAAISFFHSPRTALTQSEHTQSWLSSRFPVFRVKLKSLLNLLFGADPKSTSEITALRPVKCGLD